MKKVSAILLCLLLLCGCSNNIDLIGDIPPDEDLTPVKGGEVRLFCDVPDTLNPIVTGYKSVGEVMYLVYDGLFRTENDFSATPVLSSGYSANAGNTQYVVRLKKSIKFHDGSDFGAEDVVATFENIRKVSSKYNVNLSNVSSCVAQSDGSVVFNLATPQSNFVNLLDFPIMPSEAGADAYVIENRYFTPIGTGKFKVETMVPHKLTLTRYEDYHGDKPYVENVSVTYVKDTSIAKYSFEAMEFDVITTDLYSWGDTSMSGDFATDEYESNRLTYLGFDCANTVLSDASVRKALSTAIDKTEIVTHVMFTHAAPAWSPVNPNAYFADNDYVHTVYERGKAKEILKSAGWLDLDGDGVLDKYFDEQQLSLSFNLIVNSENDDAVRLASYLAEHMLQEGIRLNIVGLPYWQYVAAIGNGEFDMFIGRTDISNDCDVSFMLSHGSNKNFFRYGSSAMEGALYNIHVAEGAHGIKNAYKSFDTVFKDECPFVPLYFETDAVFTSVRIKGDMNISRTGVFTGMYNTFVKYKD
ncbi:MAG: ABC transporter substrate-binding protein [Clostridia bacterium]|nr:ABC transporter substrate-binding protein [Clostridia bacterium]